MYAQLAAHGSVKTFVQILCIFLLLGVVLLATFSVSMRSIDLHLGPMFERGQPERRKKDGNGANWKYRDDGFVYGILGFGYGYR